MNREGEPTTYQRPMTVFWSRAHHQRHLTVCLMKFAVGKRNVAIGTDIFASGCVILTYLSQLIQPMMNAYKQNTSKIAFMSA